MWNAEFRAFLQEHVTSFLNEYYSSPSISESESEQAPLPSPADKFFVDYFSISPYPIAGNVHLPLFLKNPTYQLRDPLYVAVSRMHRLLYLGPTLSLCSCATPGSLSRACGRNSKSSFANSRTSRPHFDRR